MSQQVAGQFATTASAAAVLVACLLVAASLKGRPFCRDSVNIPSALCCAAGLVLFCFAGSMPSFARVLAAVLVGVGLPFQYVLWGQAYCVESLTATFTHACAAMLAASCVAGASIFAGRWQLLVGAACVAVCGVLLALPGSRQGVRPDGFTVSAERLRSAASDLWRPLCGLGLCLVITGFAIGAQTVGESITHSTGALFAQMAGCALSAAVLPALARASSGKFSLNTLLQLLLPPLAGILILGWLVKPAGTPPFFTYVVNLGTGLCDGAFAVALWVYLTATVHEGSVSPTAVFGGAFALMGAAVTVPALLFGVLHNTLAQVVVPVLTVLYLAATSVAYVAQGTEAPPAAEPRNIDGACDGLARDFGLTAREREVLGFLARGRTADYVAGVLCISPHTVKGHIKHVHQKIGVSSRQEILDMLEERC